MRTSIVSAIALAALGLGAALPAGATTRTALARDEQAISTTVRFGDLDLKTRQGADKLYGRLNIAARHVCNDSMEPYERLTHAFVVCRDDALSEAVQEVNRPLLTQVYDQHLPKYAGSSAAHHVTTAHAPHA